MNLKNLATGAAVVSILLFAAFIYRPSLFGFYGADYEQCFFMYAANSPTSRQTEWIDRRCKDTHYSNKRTRATEKTDVSGSILNKGRNLFADEGTKTPAEAFGLGAREKPRTPTLEGWMASDEMKAFIQRSKEKRSGNSD